MSNIETPEKIEELPLAVIKSMLGLATSGFGVVVALAWNEVIRKFVSDYVDIYFGKNGGIISLLIYAVVVTLLAVFVTMQMVGVQRKIEKLQQNREEKRKLKAKK